MLLVYALNSNGVGFQIIHCARSSLCEKKEERVGQAYQAYVTGVCLCKVGMAWSGTPAAAPRNFVMWKQGTNTHGAAASNKGAA